MIVEYIVIGFLSALGWWGANHYVIEPYLPPPIERKKEEKKNENSKTDGNRSVSSDG